MVGREVKVRRIAALIDGCTDFDPDTAMAWRPGSEGLTLGAGNKTKVIPELRISPRWRDFTAERQLLPACCAAALGSDTPQPAR